MTTKILKLLYKLLAFFSRLYIKRTKTTIIGITGTVGKTTCRTVVAHILNVYLKDKKVYTSPKNYNSEIGLVISIFGIEDYKPNLLYMLMLVFVLCFKAKFMEKKYDILVLEYGIDRPHDMEFLLTVAIPDIAVFTKLDYTHSEFFGTKEKVGDEKIKLLFNAKKKAYLNAKDDFCTKVFEDIPVDKEYYFSKDDISDYNFFASEKKNCQSSFKTLGIDITTNAMGEANAYYINLGFRLVKDLGGEIPRGEIFLTLEGQNGRFSIINGFSNSILVDSSYNAGPESMRKIIDDTIALSKLVFPDYKIGFVLGDMREIGDSSKDSHESIIEHIKGADLLFTVGQETKKYLNYSHKGLKNIQVINFLSSREAGKKLKDKLASEDSRYVILFKGSQNTIFVEEALKEVLENKIDEHKLVRQNSPWPKIKNDFYNSLEKETNNK